MKRGALQKFKFALTAVLLLIAEVAFVPNVSHAATAGTGACQQTYTLTGTGDVTGERILRFTVNKGRKEWRERFNYDVGSYFSAMYRGLKELMGARVEWRVERMGAANLPDPLFEYEKFFAKEKELRGTVKSVSSLARAAIQIKFDVSLIQRNGDQETLVDKTQLVWSYRPESIGLAMVSDMRRLLEKVQ